MGRQRGSRPTIGRTPLTPWKFVCNCGRMSLTVRWTRVPPTILKHFRSGSSSLTWRSVSRTSLYSMCSAVRFKESTSCGCHDVCGKQAVVLYIRVLVRVAFELRNFVDDFVSNRAVSILEPSPADLTRTLFCVVLTVGQFAAAPVVLARQFCRRIECQVERIDEPGQQRGADKMTVG